MLGVCIYIVVMVTIGNMNMSRDCIGLMWIHLPSGDYICLVGTTSA